MVIFNPYTIKKIKKEITQYSWGYSSLIISLLKINITYCRLFGSIFSSALPELSFIGAFVVSPSLFFFFLLLPLFRVAEHFSLERESLFFSFFVILGAFPPNPFPPFRVRALLAGESDFLSSSPFFFSCPLRKWDDGGYPITFSNFSTPITFFLLSLHFLLFLGFPTYDFCKW